MDEVIKKKWSDFNAMTWHILSMVFIFGFIAYSFATDDFKVKIFALVLFIAFFLSASSWPIRILNNKIVMARDRIFPFPRKAISFNDVISLEISDQLEPRGPRQLVDYKTVRVVDKNGVKYKNSIAVTSIKEFKEFVNSSVEGLVNKII